MEAWRSAGFFSGERLAFCRRLAVVASSSSGGEGAEEPPKKKLHVSAADELAADFDDEDDELDEFGEAGASGSGWERSDKASFMAPVGA